MLTQNQKVEISFILCVKDHKFDIYFGDTKEDVGALRSSIGHNYYGYQLLDKMFRRYVSNDKKMRVSLSGTIISIYELTEEVAVACDIGATFVVPACCIKTVSNRSRCISVPEY